MPKKQYFNNIYHQYELKKGTEQLLNSLEISKKKPKEKFTEFKKFQFKIEGNIKSNNIKKLLWLIQK